jgi:hypothetical protein
MFMFLVLLAICFDSSYATPLSQPKFGQVQLAVEAGPAPAPSLAPALSPALAPASASAWPLPLPQTSFWSAQNIVLFLIAPGSAIVGLAFVIFMRHLDPTTAVSGDLEIVEREPENLDEDVYGAGIAALVRDSHSLVAGKGDLALRLSRLASNCLMMVFVLSLQIWVISQMQTLVCGRAVAEIRKIYGRYEFIMYGADMNHIYLTPNGFPRGLDQKYFDMANFDLLTIDEQDLACAIPFSQPQLLLPILFIWTLTIVADLRRCGDLFIRLILSTPTISSMEHAVEEGDGETHTVVGLTKTVKAAITVICLIPRWIIDIYILWLGCRWLAATPSFGDLLLNAVALEFILLLKDALYTGIMPDRTKRATQNTLIQPWQKTEPANYRLFLSAFLLMAVTLAWVLFYVYRFQAVLPDYKWDVAAACKAYVAKVSSGKKR